MRLGLLVCLAALLAVGCGDQTPASLQFVDVAPSQPRLGDITTLRFKAIDSRGNPQAGVTVNFALQDTGQAGVTLNPTVATTNKDDGIASTQLVVTGRVNSVVVVATSGDKTALAPPINFAGSAPSAVQFTFQCGPFDGPSSGGIHAIRVYDESRHMTAGVKLKCTAHVADRNGDGIPNAQVSFLTEAGTIGPTETSATDVVGNADVLYKSSLPLPEDVDPGNFSWNPPGTEANPDPLHTGDYLVPLWMEPSLWSQSPVNDQLNCDASPGTCVIGNVAGLLPEPRRFDPMRLAPDGGQILLNPRDNLVTMIAITAGEEAFIDTNNNGTYDNGEPFTDTTEPFVDSNDNGTWDPGERYVDTNGNGKWDGKNGKFDSNTLIWTEEKILWTGIPSAFDSLPPDPTIANEVLTPLGVPTTNYNIPGQGSIILDSLFADPWFNGMTRDGSGDGCQAVTTSAVTGTAVAGGAKGIKLVYPPIDREEFAIQDARGPDAGVEAYAANISCNFTDSPEAGGQIVLVGARAAGTVGP